MRDAAEVALAADMALGSSVWGDVTATDTESLKVSSWCVITVSLVCMRWGFMYMAKPEKCLNFMSTSQIEEGETLILNLCVFN